MRRGGPTFEGWRLVLTPFSSSDTYALKQLDRKRMEKMGIVRQVQAEQAAQVGRRPRRRGCATRLSGWRARRWWGTTHTW